MGAPRIHDPDAVLDRWDAGMRTPDIAAVLGMSKSTVASILQAARLDGDPRAHGRPNVSSQKVLAEIAMPMPLHVELGIRPETVFVPTLDPSPNHLRVPVTVSSLRGGPVVYGRSTFRGRIGAVRAAVGRAVMMHSEAAE